MKRIYEISEAEEVKADLGDRREAGKILRKEKDTILNFGDGRIERMTLGQDGRLFVEHFNPASTYPDGPPEVIGIGLRSTAIVKGTKIPAGKWTTTYLNKVKRIYYISDAEEVQFTEGGLRLSGNIRRKEKETIINFGDGKLERVTLGQDGRQFVEHFNPISTHPDGSPEQIGIGIRSPARAK